MPAHVAPAGDVESPGHAVQDPPPDASLYVPASHAVHGPPLGPVYPAMHSQSPLSSLPAFTCAQMHIHTGGHRQTHMREKMTACVCVVCLVLPVCPDHAHRSEEVSVDTRRGAGLAVVAP